jgi:hypothetical protein
MNNGNKFMILFVLISSIGISSMSYAFDEKAFAQSDGDSNNNNVIGQEGEGNKASQSESSSQETNQNSMCVSGESTSLSCNNLSSESIGATVPGEQGPAGPQGEQGPQGLPGKDGARGPAGPQGEPGKDGATGPMGPEGAQGPQGAIGPMGPQGPKGDTGATGAVGSQGPKGDTGATGATGVQGSAGPQSIAGKIYSVDGTAAQGGIVQTSRASCSEGDSIVSGSYRINTPSAEGAIEGIHSVRLSESTWSVDASINPPDGIIRVQAVALCVDNP